MIARRGRHTRNCVLADAEDSRQLPDAFALRSFPRDESPLVMRQLEFWPHLYAARNGTLLPLTGSALNQVALEFGKTAQDGKHETPVGRRRVGPTIVQRSKARARSVELIQNAARQSG